MKLKSLIVLLLVGIITPVFAQQKSWTGHMSFSSGTEWPDTSIVRTWNDNFVVSKFTYGGKRYLGLCQINNFMGTSANDTVDPSAWRVPLPDSLDILDFCIINDSLVFCGIYAGTEAAYGVVSPALNNKLSPNKDVFRFFHTPSVSKLSRLIVTQGKMFAVGEYQNTAACIVEVEDILGAASAMRYAYVGAGTGTTHEILDDVVAVDDRIAFLGRDARQTGYNQLTLRSVNTSLGLLDPELGNDYHWMAPEQNILPNARGAATEGGNMAIAFAQTNLQTGEHSLQVHHMMPWSGFPTTQSAQGYQTSVASMVSEVVYIQPSHWLTVLYQLNGFASRFSTFVTSGSSGSPMYYVTDDRYNSMDLLGTGAIVGWGKKKIFLQKANYPATSCLTLNSITIYPYPIHAWHSQPETISVQTHPLSLLKRKLSANTASLDKICAE